MTIIVDEALSALSNKISNDFLLKLEENSNAITIKPQLYFSSSNVTCFKYVAAFSN